MVRIVSALYCVLLKSNQALSSSQATRSQLGLGFPVTIQQTLRFNGVFPFPFKSSGRSSCLVSHDGSPSLLDGVSLLLVWLYDILTPRESSSRAVLRKPGASLPDFTRGVTIPSSCLLARNSTRCHARSMLINLYETPCRSRSYGQSLVIVRE